MATIVVKVCEECGTHSASADGWLTVAGIDITCARTGETVARIAEGTDLCSPGCLLRHISKSLEPAMNVLFRRRAARADTDETETRMVA